MKYGKGSCLLLSSGLDWNWFIGWACILQELEYVGVCTILADYMQIAAVE